MTRRFSIAVLASFVLAVAVGAPVLAHPGEQHKIFGTVTMMASDHVMLKDKDGKDVIIQITKDTKVLKDKKAVNVEDIKVGMRVVVTAMMEKDKMMAMTIELGAAQPAK